MVKIPELAEDGQNWKIYRAKYLEVAATENLLSIVAGWESDDGSKDWDHRNRVACMLLYITLPPLLRSRIRLLENAQEVFRYLAYYFLDAEPIADPRAKKFAARANEVKHDPSAENPTSEYAAIGAERENPPTKDLTRGTEDVDNRNVGRTQDPCTSSEASAEGNSAECANGTLVLLTGEPHETQNVPQDSLPLTPRPPIEGEPNACKQEATDGVVTAERMIGTVETAEPTETDADVARTALLGGEPAKKASIVDEGDETERDGQSQLQQIEFYCKEDRQHEENANVPNAHGAPLEGEWAVCASGESRESKGCERGTSVRTCIDDADGDAGREVKLADVPNESDTLVTTSIELESPYNGGIPRVHLGCTSWRASDANGAGNRTDGSTGQADGLRGLTDVLRTSNNAETDGMSSGEGAETYLGAGDAKRIVNAMGGVGSHANASSGHTDVPNVQTNANKPANTPEIVSIPRKREKPPDSPMETARRRPDEPNGCGSHADASSARTHAHCVGNKTETAGNEAEHVRTRRNGSRTQNSPNAIDIATAKLPRRWRKVSIGGGDVYVPFNAPIAIPMRRIVFGRPESGDEAIAPSLEGERAGDGDGDGNRGDGDDGDANGTTSGGDADSMRVEAALLAAKSQYMCYRPRSRRNDLPTSSGPPIQPERCPYRLARCRPRRRRLKIEQINGDQVSKAQKVETTHLAHAYATQPPENDPNQAYGVVRPRRRRGRIKIAPINVSRALEVEKTYLGRANALRSTWRPEKKIREVNKLTFEYRMPGERWRDDEDHG